MPKRKNSCFRHKRRSCIIKTTLIISLIILLGILFIFLYRENFLKRKLKVSEAELKTRNEELMVSREELRKAKDIAEASSRMKQRLSKA